MTVRDFDIKAALLKSGKAEFLEHGFEKASLRSICSRANVTTGALYSNFKAKDDLFCAIVEDDLRAYNEIYDGLIDRVVSKASQGENGEIAVMEFVMEHRDLFKLLFDCSSGSSYEGFKDGLLAKFDRTYQQFFDAYAPGRVDAAITRTVVRMKFAQYVEMIYSDYSYEEVMRITSRLSVATKAGFEALLGVRFESPG